MIKSYFLYLPLSALGRLAKKARERLKTQTRLTVDGALPFVVKVKDPKEMFNANSEAEFEKSVSRTKRSATSDEAKRA
jgi:hypothetical protein